MLLPNFEGHGCWLADVPENCWVEGGCVGPTIGWLYGGLVLIATFVRYVDITSCRL